MLTVLCLILIISSKNCHDVSTALQLCGYPPWSIATATTPSLTPRTDQKSTQVYLLQKVIYCARASRTKMASPRFFKESLRSVEFKPIAPALSATGKTKRWDRGWGEIWGHCDAEYNGETARTLGTRAKWPKWTPEISARLRSQVCCVWAR